MKMIEKTTRDGDIQYFEIIETKAEIHEFLKDLLSDSLHKDWGTHEFEDEDGFIYFYNKDGSSTYLSHGDEVKKMPDVYQMTKFMSGNGYTITVYGNCPIIYNEEDGYWDVDFD